MNRKNLFHRPYEGTVEDILAKIPHSAHYKVRAFFFVRKMCVLNRKHQTSRFPSQLRSKVLIEDSLETNVAIRKI